MTEPHGFDQRRKALEASFFARRNQDLLDQMRADLAAKEAKESLKAQLGTDDDALVAAMVREGIGPDTVTALSLIPLVAVAWADDRLDNKEREAVLKAAESQGIQSGSPSYQLLITWLDEKPHDELLSTWSDYVSALKSKLDAAEHRRLGEQLLGKARKVAQAAGGFLGIHAVSDAEEQVLDRLKQPFK